MSSALGGGGYLQAGLVHSRTIEPTIIQVVPKNFNLGSNVLFAGRG
jgi:hypothetical protein